MADLNNTLNNIRDLRKKVLGDLASLLEMHAKAADDVQERYRMEYQQNGGSVEGLEDFYALNNIMRKNNFNIRNAHALVNRMMNTEGFDISEEVIETKKLDKILQTK